VLGCAHSLLLLQDLLHPLLPPIWQNLLLMQQWQNLLLPTWHNLMLQLRPKVCMLACRILYRCIASMDMYISAMPGPAVTGISS